MGWRGILVLAAVCSLTLSVATRYCASPISQTAGSHVAKTRLAETKVQHLVQSEDGAQGLAPVRHLAILPMTSFQPQIAVESSPVPIIDFADVLSGRAPPLVARLL